MNSPAGLKTWLPSDVRKQEFVSTTLISLYENFAYQPIVIPTIVDFSLVTKANAQFNTDVFKVLDRDGRTLALRTELTQPIAKTIALRADEIKFPCKLYYNSNVFRYKGIATDDSREIQQVGVEHFGSGEAQNFSDHETVYLLIESALQLGLTDFKIVITHTKIWQKIFELCDDATLAYGFLLAGDLVEFRKLAEENKIYKLILESSNVEDFEKALKIDLSLLKSLMDDFLEYLSFDPMQCPDMNLYTGIHFSLYASGEGKLIAMGGRYDLLCKSFGKDLPAIGFAFYIPRLLKLLLDKGLLANTIVNHDQLKPKTTWQETLNEIRKMLHTKKKVILVD